MQNPHARHRALLVVDMQIGLFSGSKAPYDGAQVLANINELIRRARSVGASIFAARHTGAEDSPIAPGSPLTQLLPDLAIDAAADVVFDKGRPNCFLGTGLAEIPTRSVRGGTGDRRNEDRILHRHDLPGSCGFGLSSRTGGRRAHLDGHVRSVCARYHRPPQSDVGRAVRKARAHGRVFILGRPDW